MRQEYDISIITVNYNGFADTCALIDSISPICDYSVELIIVDNASRNDEAAMIEKKYHDNTKSFHQESIPLQTSNTPHTHIKVIRSEKNLGFAGGNNLGIRQAKGRFLFLINNDTVFECFSDIIHLVKRLESSPEIGMVCPKIRFADANRPIQFAGYTPLSTITIRNRAIGFGEEDHEQYDTAHPTPYGHGAAMMLKHEVIERAGMMPECFFLYYEEIDWSITITNAGYRIWYEPLLTVFHKESRSTGQNSPLRTYYITRNRLLLVKRNFHGIGKYASYLYLTVIVAVRDIVKHYITGRNDLAKATMRGILNFFKL